ncbi:hypothetical protein QBC46DRAFT_393303 [Diplogelasinospora grovesii]|uniref:Uncharacterized protein n=1 Tax=Diplogelasinospora grovesii TaxID=303347 RepID=A0AAN6N4C4_9PEZI|nr:hypothetical protein QBC46DRAFT_393303 [Diplogelasinospora grovesii]
MNSDDLTMADQPGTSMAALDLVSPGASSDIGFGGPAGASDGGDNLALGDESTPSLWSTTAKQYKEEFDKAKARITDQKFSSTNYPDPLKPRQLPHPKQYPMGVTPQTEQRLKELIIKIRAENA